ncbi:hypothetical protein [Flavobacterium columnare]|uniref:Peptidase S24/S26A/S26B/S26C domain-containing protein n=1 Tax=Flavobacterium columnare TaxID=996 RepID=A0AA94JNC4_9FLAO|nr:hypothetical protein [Flavobacterium columnare]MCH4828926.1 peptidase S24 [Flavobacterium columnare]MCH4831688.1 peptidase S24 [Flavobacterium columnare]
MSVVKRIKEYIDFKGVTNQKLEMQIGYSNGAFGSQLKNNKTIGSDKLENILIIYSDLNPEWLLTGNGEMLKGATNEGMQKRNLIPLYEDVETIGGTQLTAGLDTTFNSSVKIDAGDWFNGATAAIRHYGDSMIEYESGCTLVIRELKDKNEIIWGRNYVVETDEMRITKKIANYNDEYIMCYSTNYDTYPDGTLIHQPIKIKKSNIRHLSRVLGCVNKEESTGKVRFV